MKTISSLILSTSPSTLPARKPRLTTRALYRRTRRRFAGKEQDSETGLHYYGARYLDSRTGRWLSGDPAVGDYVPQSPVDDEARKRNESLPGQGGVFNYVNLHVYHYAGNNPIRYTDPDGREDADEIDNGTKALQMLYMAVNFIDANASLPYEIDAANKIKDMMNNGKVQLDNIKERTGYDDYSYYDVQRDIIVIDIDRAVSGGMEELIDSLTHEGIHAVIGNKSIESMEQYTNEEYIAYNAGLHMGNKYRSQNNIRVRRTEWTYEEVKKIVESRSR